MQNYPFIHTDDPSAEPADNLQMLCAHDHPAQPVEWLWPGKIPIGKVSMIIGDPGTGKTLVALDIAARISRAGDWPDAGASIEERGASNIRALDPRSSLLAPSSTLILSATDDLADTLRPRLDAASADPRSVFFIPSITDLRHDFAQLRAAVNRAPNVRLIIIDPINAFVGPTDSHFHSVLRRVLEPLAKLAAEKRIAVVAIAHLRKNDGAAIHRAAGSMGFVAAARAVWTLSRDDENPGRVLLLPIKNNLTAAARGLAFTIESRAATDAPTISWDPNPIDATEETPRACEVADINAARKWLRKALANGPRTAWDIEQEAAQFGFHVRTLRRALHAIGGQTQKGDILNGWWWSLPAVDPSRRSRHTPCAVTDPSCDKGQEDKETRRQGEPEVLSFPIPHSARSLPAAAGNPKSTVPPTTTPALRALSLSKPQPPAPTIPVPLCPLPEIFNEPAILPASTSPSSVAESIRAINRLDRQRHNRRHRSADRNPQPQLPKTGNAILDEILDALRKPPPNL